MTAPAAPVWPPEGGAARWWVTDLLFGARLAVGGTRAGRLRIALVAAGTGAAVAVLLLAASVGHVRATQHQREYANAYTVNEPEPGVDPLRILPGSDPYEGHLVRVFHVRAEGPRAPVPPGLDRIPGPGEQVLSPALAALLASPDGAGLRPRYPGRTVGTVGRPGLVDGPRDLVAYVGSADLVGNVTYRFGVQLALGAPLSPLLWTLLVVGVVALLVPLLLLVAVVSRLSAAQRRRRLAAIRLVGADAAQTRRLAAGEVLAGALLGLLVGAALFAAVRPLTEWAELAGVASFAGVQPFAADVRPAWPSAVLVAVVVPALAVLTAIVALRGTLADPLGAVRAARPARRRVLWRLLVAAAGVALLAWPLRAPEGEPSPVVLVAGAVLVLLAVPALLPWLLERAVRRPVRRTPAVQLATRRLQLDPGPPGRLVGGLAVTLAGAIGLGALLAAGEQWYGPADRLPVGHATVQILPPYGPETAGLADRVRAVPGVTGVTELRTVLVGLPGQAEQVVVGPCAALRAVAELPSCVDGRLYGSAGDDLLRAGSVRVRSPAGEDTPYTVSLRPAPGEARALDGSLGGILYATPGAVRSVPAGQFAGTLEIGLDEGDPGAIARLRTAVAPAGGHAVVDARDGWFARSPDQRNFAALRRALLAGAALLLLLTGVVVLVQCLQQLRDARRPLAVLAAAGVPRSVLVRSAVWQNAIPAVVGVLLADAAGVTLAVLLLRLAVVPVQVDWALVGLLSAAALAALAAATALSLPAVAAAARPDGLRSE